MPRTISANSSIPPGVSLLSSPGTIARSGIMISIEDAADTLIPDLFMDKEAGYDEWLFGKVSRTMARVDAGETGLHEHADAMAQLKERLKAGLARKVD